MEAITTKKQTGLSPEALKRWGLAFLACGAVSRGLLQNHLLQMGQRTAQELFQAMEQSARTMQMATLALVLQAAATCFVPVAAFLLVSAFASDTHPGALVRSLALLALLSELPYNLALSGSWLHPGSTNPVFGLLAAAVVLYAYTGAGQSAGPTLKIAVTAAAFLWCLILRPEGGAAVLLVSLVLYAVRGRDSLRTLAGVLAAALCSLGSPMFLLSPMGFLLTHFCNPDKPARRWPGLAYPAALLLVFALRAVF